LFDVLNTVQRLAVSGLCSGLVTFERRALTKGREINWDESRATFTNLYVTSKGTIEKDAVGMLQVNMIALHAS